jgi:ERCC4-type nuclease
MIIIIDQNEKSTNPAVYDLIKKSFSNVIVTNLPHREHGGVKVTAGDINIPLEDGNILAIERKTPHDFLQSIGNRHIFHQVEVMAQHAKYSVIIVTGKFLYTEKSDMVRIDGEEKLTNWTGASVRAAMTAIQFSGCPIIFCPSNKYCMAIAEIYNTVNKPDKHQGIIKNRIITFPPIDDRIQFLAQLPNVGMKKADSLLKFAGKMDNNADADGYGTLASALHWMSILVQINKKERPAGWGPELILNTRIFFGLAENEYLAPVIEDDNQVIHISGTSYIKLKFKDKEQKNGKVKA